MQHPPRTGQKRLPLLGSVAVAITASLLASVWFVGPPAGASAALENRPPVELPEIDSVTMGDPATYAQVEAWAKDNVRVKPLAVDMVNATVESLTGLSGSTRVVYGRPLNQNRQKEMFSASEFTDRCWRRPAIEEFRLILNQVRTAAAIGGKKVVFLVAPSKYRALGGLLGDRLSTLASCASADDALIAQIALEYPDMVKVVDPNRAVSYAPSAPYWVGDTHWTPKAGRALTEQVIAEVANVSVVQAGAIMANRLKVSGEKGAGGLFRLSGLMKETYEPLLLPKSKFAPNFKSAGPGTASFSYSWTSPYPVGTAAQSMLILHDSFVNVPVLTKQFSSVVASGYDVHWRNIQDLDYIPPVETVVVESIDRTFLAHLMSYVDLEDLANQDGSMFKVIAYLQRTAP